MKFSESWLREWVNPAVSTDVLVEQLTMAGLEVDAVEPVAGEFSGVVVGEIVETSQHPDADKLRICSVKGPDEALVQVVCGAPNARPGLKVPFAMIGAVLPGDFKIKKAKLRGIESFGMLCGETELKVGEDDAGLMELATDAPIGQDIRSYLDLDDSIIEVDLTPNRSDCLGLKGLAREVGVLNRADVSNVQITPQSVMTDACVEVTLAEKEACPLYISRVIKGIDVSAPSPRWLQERLRRSDIRPIDAVVDVTNYVLMELGQPMHAFDLSALDGGITVRMAKEQEQITLLNEQELVLNADTVVIADDTKALAIAGIMGGKASAVTETTKDIVLEVAFFNPISIAGKARNYGLHTDSSHRFERGVDFGVAEQAMERATELILASVGGEPGPTLRTEASDNLPTPKRVVLRKERIIKGLGFPIPDADVVEILTRLGLSLAEKSDGSWTFTIPSYRFDISIEADLLEELARIYGYNQLPTTTNMVPQILPSKTESVLDAMRVKGLLVSRGYREVITYSFIDPVLHKRCFGEQEAVSLLNPISADLSVMRTSLIPGLLQTLSNNVNRQHTRVRLFETGLRFKKTGDELVQSQGVAGLLFGARTNKSWLAEKDDVDFYDIKGDVEAMLQLGDLEFSFEPEQRLEFMHPGQTASVRHNGVVIGYVGALHPQLLKAQGLSKNTFVFELDLDAVLESHSPVYMGISRYPEVERDLAFIVPAHTPASNLESAIESVAGENLKELKVFDIYSGEGIDSERKSIAFHLTFQHSSRTLNEDEVNVAVEAVVNKLEGEFNAALRQ